MSDFLFWGFVFIGFVAAAGLVAESVVAYRARKEYDDEHDPY